MRLVDVGLTSMDMVNLMLGVEAEFDFTIPQSHITPENFQSVKTLERMIGAAAQTRHGDLTDRRALCFGLVAEKPRCLKAVAALEVRFIATMGLLTTVIDTSCCSD